MQKQVDRATIRVVLAITAAVLIVQSSYLVAFSTMHGVSESVLFALGIAAAPLLTLCVAYLVVRRRSAGKWVLLVLGMVLFGTMEYILPVSPFKTTVVNFLQRRALEVVEIRNVQDEIFLSPQGNPVGVRVSFEALFPRGGILSVSPSLWAEEERLRHYQTSMGHLAGTTVTPQPSKGSSEDYRFAAGVRYRFTADFLPTFLTILSSGVQDLARGDLCIWERESPTLSLQGFRDLVQEPLETRYRIEVKVSGNTYFVAPRVAYSGVSTRGYSLKTFYDGATLENAPPCPW